MNEAQFLLALGYQPAPRREGFPTPAIIPTKTHIEMWDSELDGTVMVPTASAPKYEGM